MENTQELQLAQKIIQHYQPKPLNFSQKFYYQIYLQSLIDHKAINKLQTSFKQFPEGTDLLDFIRLLLDVMPYKNDDTFFLVVCGIEIFKAICMGDRKKNHIDYKDFLNHVTDVFKFIQNYFSVSDSLKDQKLQERQIPLKKQFDIKKEEVRLIDIQTAKFFNKSDDQIKRINKDKFSTDSIHHKEMFKHCFYSSQNQIIFALESRGYQINIFDLRCNLINKIIPKGGLDDNGNRKDLMIISLFFSDRQQRIGASLKDMSLCFWDLQDNFQFEKKVSVQNQTFDNQTNIWYIEFLNLWITTDNTLAIYCWDLENEVIDFKMQKINPSTRIKTKVLDMVELAYIKKIALACQDKSVQIWDLYNERLMMKIDLTQGGIHTMVFFEAFQVMLIAGYETTVNIIEIDYGNQVTYFTQEHNLIGKLTGHSGLITSVQCIDKTPMVVTADDKCYLKVWDIRKLNCIQTVKLDTTIIVNKILDIQKNKKIGFFSNRFFMMEWDSNFPQQTIKNLSAIFVECNLRNKEIIVCTQKDVRVISLTTGRTSKVYSGLLSGQQDDIIQFRTMNNFSNFLVADHKGYFKMYDFSSGTCIREFKAHSNEISCCEIDKENTLIVTTGWDGLLNVQQIHKDSFVILRQISNCFGKLNVEIMVLCEKSNLIILGSSSSKIYIYDYEYFKCIQIIQLPESNLQYSDDEYPTAICADETLKMIVISTTKYYFYIISFEETSRTLMKLSLDAVIDQNSYDDKFFDPNEDYLCNKMLIDCQENVSNEWGFNCFLYMAFIQGQVCKYDLTGFIKKPSSQQEQREGKESNFNPYRVIKEDFQEQLLKSTKIDVNLTRDHLNKMFRSFQIRPHQKQIYCIQIMNFSVNKLITTSQDKSICIFSQQGDIEARLNINHPLPMSWQLKGDHLNDITQSIIYGLKVLEGIQERSNLTFNEKRKVGNIVQFVKALGEDQGFFSTEIGYEQQQRPLLMNDEYTAKDFQTGIYRALFQNEIQGPSLKDMEYLKRNNILKNQKETLLKSYSNQENQMKNYLSLEAENIDYYVPNYRQNLTDSETDVKVKKYSNKDVRTRQLANKLDSILITDKSYVAKPNKLDEQYKKYQNQKRFKKETTPNVSSVQQNHSFFEFAQQREMVQKDSLNKSMKSVDNYRAEEKKLFQQIIKNIDLKCKKAKFKFLNQPMEYVSFEPEQKQKFMAPLYRSTLQVKKFQQMNPNQHVDYSEQIAKINNEIDKIAEEAKEFVKETKSKKQEMKEILMKMNKDKTAGTDETYMLVTTKEQLEKKQSKFLKKINSRLNAHNNSKMTPDFSDIESDPNDQTELDLSKKFTHEDIIKFVEY